MRGHPARRICSVIIEWSFALFLTLALAAGTLFAQEPSRDYAFLIGSGFLCDPDHADACPAIARATSGDTFEMNGAGTLSPHDKSVTAAGTFARKSPSGTVLNNGVWLATKLVSFDSYGLAPRALHSANQALTSMQAHPMTRSRVQLGPTSAGGLAVFHIRLIPQTGPTQNAVLQVNCALGDAPRERSVEGIRLTLERTGAEFSEEVSGRVIFLSMRPEVSEPAKAPQQETAPETSEPPDN